MIYWYIITTLYFDIAGFALLWWLIHIEFEALCTMIDLMIVLITLLIQN
jgi:hypothetical protein